MATKKEALTKDEKSLLVMAGGLCLLKTALETELPLLSLANDELLEAGQTLLLGAALNFGQLMNAAKDRNALPKLRAAVDKAKRNVMRKK